MEWCLNIFRIPPFWIMSFIIIYIATTAFIDQSVIVILQNNGGLKGGKGRQIKLFVKLTFTIVYGGQIYFCGKLIFGTLPVHGQQHSFGTGERIFIKNSHTFWGRKCQTHLSAWTTNPQTKRGWRIGNVFNIMLFTKWTISTHAIKMLVRRVQYCQFPSILQRT